MNNKVMKMVVLSIVLLLLFNACGKSRKDRDVNEMLEHQNTVPFTNVTSSEEIEKTTLTETTVPTVLFDDANGTLELEEVEAENKQVNTNKTESTKIEPKPTEPKPAEAKPTEPKPTEAKPTEPKPTEPEPTEPEPTESKSGKLSLEVYNSMSSAEKQACYESFESMEAFLEWYDAALAEYEANRDVANFDGSSVDLGDLIGK